jgi:hypothetical protein
VARRARRRLARQRRGSRARPSVTFIDSTGKVAGDSEFDPPALEGLENHLTRPEVQPRFAPAGTITPRQRIGRRRRAADAGGRAGSGFARVSVSGWRFKTCFAARAR